MNAARWVAWIPGSCVLCLWSPYSGGVELGTEKQDPGVCWEPPRAKHRAEAQQEPAW